VLQYDVPDESSAVLRFSTTTPHWTGVPVSVVGSSVPVVRGRSSRWFKAMDSMEFDELYPFSWSIYSTFSSISSHCTACGTVEMHSQHATAVSCATAGRF
jgi:hypothetical protein